MEQNTRSQTNIKQQITNSLDLLLEGLQVFDYNWNYVYLNNTLSLQGKTSKDKLLGNSLKVLNPGIEYTDVFKALNKCMTERKAQRLINEFEFSDSTKKWFELSIEPIEEGIMVLSLDISQHHDFEEKLKKANRLYAFISQVNQHISHVKDEKLLFKNACRLAIEFGKFKIAWIGIFDNTQKKITLVEQYGLPERDIILLTSAPDDAMILQKFILKNDNYYVCNDIANDPELDFWKPYAVKHGILSTMVLPIRKGNSIIGSLNLYSEQLNYFDNDVIKLLVEVTGDISFALNLFEKDKKQEGIKDLLEQNERRFRALIEKSPDMKTLSTSNGDVLYASPSVTKFLGYSLKEFIHSSVLDYVHPDDLQELISNTKKILAISGKSFFTKQRLLHKNGKWIWCEGTITNMLHEPGVYAIVSNFIDITETVKTEKQREFDRNNLNALINNTHDLMWSVDRDFKLITSNLPFNKIVKEMSGKAIKKGGDVLAIGFLPEQLTKYRSYYKRAFAGESFSEVEFVTFPFEIWSEISYSPIWKEDVVIGTACHSRDITQRKRAEKNLRESESRLKEAQLIAHIGNWEVDLKTNVHVWSDEIYNIFGIKKESIKPSEEAFLLLLHPDDVLNARSKMENSADTLQDTSFNFRFIRRDGALCYGFTKWKYELDKNANAIRIYGIVQDTTERKKDKLKLEQQNKELIKTNAELDRFVYSVSHDLRSPLTSVLGLVSIIEDETREDDTLEHIKMIRHSISRLDEFIKNTLSYSRNNRMELVVEKINVKACIKDIIESLHNMKEADSIKFELKINEKEAFYSDIQRFNTIMENLISNAIKYHKKGIEGRYIKVTAQSNKNNLLLKIEDNGIGIAPVHHLKIFDMFFRLSGKTDGSGIGLYIVKEILNKLQGSIKIESKEGKGTSFDITIKNLIT